MGIAKVSQAFLLPAIIIAVIITEYADIISKHMTRKIYFIVAFSVGVFGGILGAGILLIIIALVRIRITDDKHIYEVRANALLLELVTAIAAILVFIFSDVLIHSIWIAWATGSIIGGYLGGKLIEKTGKFKPITQKWLLRAMFAFAIGIAVYRLF